MLFQKNKEINISSKKRVFTSNKITKNSRSESNVQKNRVNVPSGFRKSRYLITNVYIIIFKFILYMHGIDVVFTGASANVKFV
jgi:hypothetical protein